MEQPHPTAAVAKWGLETPRRGQRGSGDREEDEEWRC